MSNQNKTTTAKEEQATHALVPKLRFPEFRDVWRTKTLGSLGYFTGGGTPSKENEAYWTGEIPWISSSDLIEDSISQIRINRFITKQAVQDSATKLVPAKTILLISRVGVGKLALSTFPLCTSQDFTNFTPTAADPLFLVYLLKSRKETLLSFNQGTSIKGFTKDNIATLESCFPSTPEQQKIAECLSSVDELITAQARKLDALMTHKKGLMQQLFPRAAETQPRLRFPEFREAGEWEEKSLSSFCKVGDIDHKMPSSVAEGIPYVMTGDFFGINNIDFDNSKKISSDDYEKLSKKIKPERGDIVMARYASVGAVRHIETSIQFLVSYSCAIIKCERPENSKFLYYILQSEAIQSRIGSEINMSSQKNIGIDSIKKLKSFLSTPVEQKKLPHASPPSTP
jgi:restriction endonuclease S subunit